MNWHEGPIEGVVMREAAVHADGRGWLCELFRKDTCAADLLPVTAYVSVTRPGCSRGPHEHRDQTDLFGFVGPGDFRIRLWDPRPESPTRGHCTSLKAGAGRPLILTVPPRVVHAYVNDGQSDAWVLNFPNRLYRGEGRREPVDEVRYEDRPDHPYRLDG